MSFYRGSAAFRLLQGGKLAIRFHIRPVQAVPPHLLSLLFSSSHHRAFYRYFYSKQECREWFHYLKSVHLSGKRKCSFFYRGQLSLFQELYSS
jgi:hypothetical protein